MANARRFGSQHRLNGLASLLINATRAVPVSALPMISGVNGDAPLAISESIKAFAKNRRVITIARRLRTNRRAGRKIVMDRGQVVEQGTHEALMAGQRVNWGLNGDG
jgi:ATP-binding cassette subfamily B protein